MSSFFTIDTLVNIPLFCPNTEKHYGKITKIRKKELLGKIAYIKKIDGKKIVVSKHKYSLENWFFHESDLLLEEKEPVKIAIQTFDPENLVV